MNERREEKGERRLLIDELSSRTSSASGYKPPNATQQLATLALEHSFAAPLKRMWVYGCYYGILSED